MTHNEPANEQHFLADVRGKGVDSTLIDQLRHKFGVSERSGETLQFVARARSSKSGPPGSPEGYDLLALTSLRLLAGSERGGVVTAWELKELIEIRLDAGSTVVTLVAIQGHAWSLGLLHAQDANLLADRLHGYAPRLLGGTLTNRVLRAQGRWEANKKNRDRDERQRARADRGTARAAVQEKRQANKESKLAGRAESHAEEVRLYGRRMEKVDFGGKTVEVFERGYVRFPYDWRHDSFEELLWVEVTANIQKKSGLGRTVGAAATGGLNLLAPNVRGDVYLTITTSTKTRSMQKDLVSRGAQKRAKQIEGAARAAMSRRDTTGERSPDAADQGSVADRLQRLTKLQVEGLVDEDEFAETRARILGTL